MILILTTQKIFNKHLDFPSQSCSTSFPGGNLVGGLPPAAHTGAGCIAPPHTPYVAQFSGRCRACSLNGAKHSPLASCLSRPFGRNRGGHHRKLENLGFLLFYIFKIEKENKSQRLPYGAKHSPPGHQGPPDCLKGGSSSLYSRTPFDSRYLWLKIMK